MVSASDLTSGIWVTFDEGQARALSVRKCAIEIVGGPEAGKRIEMATEIIRIGAKKGNDLVLDDRRVSGFHCEIHLAEDGYRIRDLESTNGTSVRGVRVREAYLDERSPITVGKSELVFTPLTGSVQVPIHQQERLAGMVGRSPEIRRVFSQLEKIAPSTATVLITGETGVGKELVAEAVHDLSERREGPFVVVDCAAVPASLFENELFGHEKGAFTGATDAAAGAFERAHGGTLFLDEIGELPLAMQPKLLRAVQSKRVRRIGAERTIDCDVRIVAATHRDLPLQINRGEFREDLYYRLAVARVHVPPLRQRREDIALLIEAFLDQIPGGRHQPLPTETVAAFENNHWPGNVRELRNAVERAVVLPAYAFSLDPPIAGEDDGLAVRVSRAIEQQTPFKRAKRELTDEFDRLFMTELLERHDWNIAAAARATGVDRVSIYKLMARLGIERSSG